MRKSALAFVMLAACVAALLLGCSASQSAKALPRDAVIGVVETRGTSEKSNLIFYDANLNEVRRLPLKYATLGNIFYDPLVYKNSLYAIPQGRGNLKDGKEVIRINLDDLGLTSYAIDQPAMNALAVNDDCIYTCNTLNGVSYINRCEIDSGKVESRAIDGRYITNIIFAGECLCAFSSDLDGANPSVLCYSEGLEFLRTIDLNGFGFAHYRAALSEDSIYFTNFEESKSEKAGYLGVLNTEHNTVGRIELNEGNLASVVAFDGDLYVTHYDLMQKPSTSSLSVVDLDTGSIKEYDLSHGADQMTIAGRSMYVLADRRIYCYDLSDMTLTKSVEVSRSGRDYSYLSGIFARDHKDR